MWKVLSLMDDAWLNDVEGYISSRLLTPVKHYEYNIEGRLLFVYFELSVQWMKCVGKYYIKPNKKYKIYLHFSIQVQDSIKHLYNSQYTPSKYCLLIITLRVMKCFSNENEYNLKFNRFLIHKCKRSFLRIYLYLCYLWIYHYNLHYIN